MANSNWQISIQAEDNVSKTLDKLNGKFNGFTSGLAKLGGIMAGAFAVKQVIDFGKECYDAYQVQLKAEYDLDKALEARGVKTEALSKAMKNVASEQQKLGVIGDEVSLDAMAKGMQLGMSEQDASGLLGLLQDVAVANFGIKESSEHLGDVYRDVAEGINKGKIALDKYGVQLTDVEKKQFKAMSTEERRAFIIDKLSKYQGRNAEATNTSLGKQVQMMNNIGDAQEKIGQAIDKVATPILNILAPAIERVCNGLAEFVDWGLQATESIDPQTWEDLGTVWESLGRIATPIFEGLSRALKALWEVFKGIVEFLAGAFTGDWGKAWDGIKNVFKGAIDFMDGVFNAFKNGVVQGFAEMLGVGEQWANEQSRLAEQSRAGNNLTFEDGWSPKGKANGTNYWEGGRVLVGEYGPELVDLPRGASVKTAQQTQRELSGGGYTINCPVTIQGNVIGNEDYVNAIGDSIVSRVKLAMGNM